jgi:hypothetical protein
MGIYWQHIDPQLEVLGNLQQINFSALQNLSKFQFNNSFVPTSLIPSRHFLEFRNNALSGFRFYHTTAFGDTHGSLKLQSFVNAEDTGIDVLAFLEDGSLNFPAPVSFSGLSITGDLDLTNHKIINLADPVNPQDAATKAFVLSVAGSSTVTLTGAVTGSGTGTVVTTLTPISVSQITDFTPGVLSFSLDQFQPPSANINMSGRKLINVPDPSAGTDGANKSYVDTRTLTLTGAITGTGSIGPAFFGFPGTNGIIATTLAPITTSLISDFSTSVSSFRLDQFAAPLVSINLNGQRIANLGNPAAGTDGTNKDYVDTGIDAAIASIDTSVTLAGAVTGSGTGTINTTFASTQEISGATQTFVYDGGAVLDSYLTLANETVIPTGDIVSTNIRLLNSTTSCGFDLHQETGAIPTENRFFFIEFSDGGSQFDTIWSVNYNSVEEVFQMNFIRPVNFTNLVNFNNVVLNNVGLPIAGTDGTNKDYVHTAIDTAIASIDTSVTLTGAVTGSGTGTVANLFNATIDAQAETQQFNFNDTLDGLGRFRLKNQIPGSARTQFEIADSSDNVIMKMGSTKNYPSDYAFIETGGFPFAAYIGSNCSYSLDSNARMVINPNGFLPLATAQLDVNGGVQNVGGEDTVIRATSSTLSTKIELNNTVPISGRNYELRSNYDGTFAIVDRNASSERIKLNTDGSVNMTSYFGFRPAASIKLYNNVTVTAVTGANVYVKVAGTTTQEYAIYFTTSSNRITYTGTLDISLSVTAILSIFATSGGGRIATAAIFKNGAIVSTSRSNCAIVSTSISSNSQIYINSIITMQTNDYLEIFITDAANANNITVRQMIFSASAT